MTLRGLIVVAFAVGLSMSAAGARGASLDVFDGPLGLDLQASGAPQSLVPDRPDTTCSGVLALPQEGGAWAVGEAGSVAGDRCGEAWLLTPPGGNAAQAEPEDLLIE